MLFILSVASLMGMSLWFSATAVTTSLSREWMLSESGQAWLTMSVQIGFVVGTITSAWFNLSDIFNARRIFAVCAWAGAFCNTAIAWWADGLAIAVFFRFLTGVFLAGVYPPAMKVMASWFKENRGLAIGTLVGALAVGSASPHFLRFAGSPDWRILMHIASASSFFAGLLCFFFVKDGPFQTAGAKFDPGVVFRALRNRSLRLANLGYLGHMWELYAMWTWLPAFLASSFALTAMKDSASWASLVAFGAIATGLAGSIVAGWLADQYGRTTVTIVSMLISGFCCLIVGLLYGGSPTLLTVLSLFWGFAIVADSAQFSAAITELCEPEYVGTMLTLQTCLGFILTVVSIRLIPFLVSVVGWSWAFFVLAAGPAFGVWAMKSLKSLPEASRIGGEQKS